MLLDLNGLGYLVILQAREYIKLYQLIYQKQTIALISSLDSQPPSGLSREVQLPSFQEFGG